MAKLVFHVVAEDPQEPHVPDDVQPPAVQKHAREKRHESRSERNFTSQGKLRAKRNFSIDHCELLAHPRAKRQLIKKH
jgi:hypothetical protein